MVGCCPEEAAPGVTLTAMPISIPMTNPYLFPLLTLCLWAGLFFATWEGGDGDALFGAAIPSFIAALVLLLPLAFIIGSIWNVATWVRDLRVYRPRRRRPP